MPALEPANGTATVVVACKLPHGLRCRLHAKATRAQSSPGGGARDVEIWEQTGEEFVLNGAAFPQNEAPRARIAHGFALTSGVRKDLWDAWLAQNKSHPAVVGGMIFAHERDTRTFDEAREKRAVRTGLERLDPNNLPSEFSRIKMAEEQKAKPMVEA